MQILIKQNDMKRNYLGNINMVICRLTMMLVH